MTRDRDFKDLVRARMAATGEPYTAARQALVDARLEGTQRSVPAPSATPAAHPARPYAVDSPAASGGEKAADRGEAVDGVAAAQGEVVAAGVEGAEHAARKLYDKTVRTFFDGPRLRAIPSKRRPRAAVLLHLLERFDADRVYTEAEVNGILRTAHDDVASLRRELVDYRYLTRGEGRYRVAEVDPERDVNEAQEVPPFEAEILAQLRDRTRARPRTDR
ncbi:MAG: DUF2087 domain-containing protein [Actinomycetales bacterium]|nr:DUF2087 domain-containing protein [Actinomycetales bacterium]